MAQIIDNTQGILPRKVSNEIFSKVAGESAIAKVCGDEPIPFVGTDVFTFSLDQEADLVAESGTKTNGGGALAPVKVAPLKYEYGLRISDEFMKASEEYQLNILKSFTDGASKKFARALDLSSTLGINPRTATYSDLIGKNNFYDATGQAGTGHQFGHYAGQTEESIEGMIAAISADSGATPNGMLYGPQIGQELAAKKTDGGAYLYPEFRFGGAPEYLGGLKLGKSTTLGFAGSHFYDGQAHQLITYAVVGDFSAFKWGYAQDITYEIIQYGNPDNSDLGDLKGHNQVYLRAEAYLGWGILDPKRFGTIVEVA